MKYDAVILDFDGPICDVFAGYPAHQVARRLRQRFKIEAYHDDPLAYIVEAHDDPATQQAIHLFVTEQEIIAVESATATPTIGEFIDAITLPFAVASNNSSEAVTKWLGLNDLQGDISFVQGRQPSEMKPDPSALLQCASALAFEPARCVFIGDSESDAIAASAASMPFIGMANRPHKVEQFKRHPHKAIRETREIFDLSNEVLATES